MIEFFYPASSNKKINKSYAPSLSKHRSRQLSNRYVLMSTQQIFLACTITLRSNYSHASPTQSVRTSYGNRCTTINLVACRNKNVSELGKAKPIGEMGLAWVLQPRHERKRASTFVSIPAMTSPVQVPTVLQNYRHKKIMITSCITVAADSSLAYVASDGERS